MNRSYWYIIGIVLSGLLIVGIIFAIKMYNKSHTDVHTTSPDYVLDAGALIAEFIEDEGVANEMYLDKIVQVTGKLVKKDATDGECVLYLSSNGGFENIQVKLNATENERALTLKKGEGVTVKGICTGFTSIDVLLTRGVIVGGGLEIGYR